VVSLGGFDLFFPLWTAMAASAAAALYPPRRNVSLSPPCSGPSDPQIMEPDRIPPQMLQPVSVAVDIIESDLGQDRVSVRVDGPGEVGVLL
jgi:hypothetical protein